jgi:hypothetical protein
MFSYGNTLPVVNQTFEHPEGMFCEICDKLIEIGEIAIELYVGKVGRGTKSGRLMLVEDEQYSETVSLHIWCATDYIRQSIWEGGDPEQESPNLCDSCGIKLDEKITGDE